RRAGRGVAQAREGRAQDAGAEVAGRRRDDPPGGARHGRSDGTRRSHRGHEPRPEAGRGDAGRGPARRPRTRGVPGEGGGVSTPASTEPRRVAATREPDQLRHAYASEADRAASPDAVLVAKGVSVRYGSVQALDAVDVSVLAGELVTVIGANGAGKSSLVNALVGVVPKAGGSVTYRGEDISEAAPERLVG